MTTIVNPDWALTHPPDMSGPAGRAWRVDLDAWRRKHPDDPASATTIATWFAHVPGSHPFWTWYAFMVVALRDVPGLPPAKKHFADAAYELMVWSLDPGHACPDPRDPERPRLLQPPDQVLQWPTLGGPDTPEHQDSRSRDLVELAILAVVDGQLVPDQDHRASWKRVFVATVQHFRDGVH